MANLNLVIHYPSGRDDYVSLEKDRYVVGSAQECDIEISDTGVEKQHLMLFLTDGTLEVVNVAKANMVRLNEALLAERSPFVLGDVLRIGDVTLSLQGPYAHGLDKSKTPDGSRKIRESIEKDVRAGWLGYRRVMEKLSFFISKDEAKTASDCYESGRKAFIFAIVFLVVGNIATSLLEFYQYYKLSSILGLCLQFLMNIAILLLVGRFRVAFAGRVLWPLVTLSLAPRSPEEVCDSYFENMVWGVPIFIGFGFLLGWLQDYGAGFVFEEKRRKAKKFAVLILSSCLVVGLTYLMTTVTPTPLPWYWSILGETPCLIWALIYKKTNAVNFNVPSDALFVAEIASRRASKRVLCQCLALALLVVPVINVLSLLGEDERRQWPVDDPDILWSDESTKEEAWFWEDKGRYFKKSDLDANDIFQVPVSVLEVKATTNDFFMAWESFAADDSDDSLINLLRDLTLRLSSHKERLFLLEHPVIPEEGTPKYEQVNNEYLSEVESFVLSDFATNLCELVNNISMNAQGITSYTNLCAFLNEYKVSSTNYLAFAQNLGTNSICVVCESIKRPPEYGKETSFVYSARLSIGISSFTHERVLNDNIDAARRKTGILLVFILTTLAVLILYRRGADSLVGFWLGLGLFANAIVFAELMAKMNGGIPSYVQQTIWRGAFQNPWYSLLAYWLSMINSLNFIFKILGCLTQTVLFVMLCWPTVKSVGKWKRRWLFIGKALLSCVIPVSIGCGMIFVSSSVLVERVVVVLVMGVWGYFLRRKRRQYTEIPQLGFQFFIGWFVFEVAGGLFVACLGIDSMEPLSEQDISVTIHQYLVTPANLPILDIFVEPGMLFCIVMPLLTFGCWIWLFVRQKFLNVLSVGGIMLILFVFGIPLASRLISLKLSACFSNNVLVSKAGTQIISTIVVFTVFPGLVKVFRGIGRRVFMRDAYKMEQRVAVAVEKIFDEISNKAETIFSVLSCMDISSFAFYERVSKADFVLMVSKNWSDRMADCLSPSEQLRRRLGREHAIVDFEQLPFRPEMFFESFELWQMHLDAGGKFLLPICLGSSVRGLLFINSGKTTDVPSDPVLVESINSLGLSSITPR